MRWLTQYRLKPAESRLLRLTDIYSIHRTVYDLFEDFRQGQKNISSGILFADKGTRLGIRNILILSDRLPKISEIGEIQSRKVSEKYLQYENYLFEIAINPVRRISSSHKREPIRGRDAIAQWFSSKAPQWGFTVHEPSLQVIALDVHRFYKDSSEITINMATLTGTLKVKERQSFVRSFGYGLGHAKTFGCGLLQLIPFGV